MVDTNAFEATRSVLFGGEDIGNNSPPELLQEIQRRTTNPPPFHIQPDNVRRMPIKTRVVSLTGDYEGWHATVRTNAPLGIFLDMSAADGAEGMAAIGTILDALPKLVTSWDFVDEEGQPLPCNPTGFKQLNNDLLMALLGAIGGNETPVVPK